MRVLAVVASVVALLVWMAAPAYGTHVSCGQTITTDTTLDSDLDCRDSRFAITFGANGVDLDLGGHTVRGDGGQNPGAFGIFSDGHRGLTIHNSTVVGFQIDVYL